MKRKKSIVSVIPMALLFAVVVGLVTYFTGDKLGLSTYRAQAKILTTNKDSVSEEDNLALAFAATIDSDAIKNKVLDNLDLDWEPTDLDKELTIVPIKGSPVINIIVEDPIKLRAEDLADEYADVSVKLLNDLYDGNTQILEYSYQNSGLKSQKQKYATYFALIAFVVWFLFGSLFTALSNNKIDKENSELVETSEKKTKGIVKEEKIEDVAEDEDNIEVTQERDDLLDDYKTLGQIPTYEEDDLDV